VFKITDFINLHFRLCHLLVSLVHTTSFFVLFFKCQKQSYIGQGHRKLSNQSVHF